MSTVGKFCLIVTLLLLLVAMAPIPLPWGGWTPRVLQIHSGWSEKLRSAKEDVVKNQAAEVKARHELMLAAGELDALKVGWDKVWDIPAPGPNIPQGAPAIGKQRGQNGQAQLVLRNLGANDGLASTQTADGKTVRPVIHAFYGGGEGVTYVGEFIATSITPTGAVLDPVHRLDPQVNREFDIAVAQEADSWPMNSPWRLRTMIPSAPRAKSDELYRNGRRTGELTQQTVANITRQQELYQAAVDALAVRRGELLGLAADDNRPPVPGRPEFTRGLLAVTEEVEEERDQLLLEIDRLRRAIKSAGENRDAIVQQLEEAAQALPGSSTESAKPDPRVAIGQ